MRGVLEPGVPAGMPSRPVESAGMAAMVARRGATAAPAEGARERATRGAMEGTASSPVRAAVAAARVVRPGREGRVGLEVLPARAGPVVTAAMAHPPAGGALAEREVKGRIAKVATVGRVAPMADRVEVTEAKEVTADELLPMKGKTAGSVAMGMTQ